MGSSVGGDFDDDGKVLSPDERCYQKDYDRLEGRTCTEEYFNKNFGAHEGLWRSRGIDHIKTEGGKHIQRRHIADNNGYFIQLNTLGEVMDFINKHGSCVLSRSDEYPALEIYNYYRE